MNDSRKECFDCRKTVVRKYILSKKGYSSKNNWEYWTEDEKNKDKYVCDSCLLNLYYKNKGKYLSKVENPKKRRVFSQYVYSHIISYSKE